MCRMLGLAGLTASVAADALRAFYPLCTAGRVRPNKSPGHLDGWGIVGYEAGRPVEFERRPRPASEDREAWDKAARAAAASDSAVILAHVRKASVGDRRLENTHPFQSGAWTFCHNGTLGDHGRLPLKRLAPQGQTDSERLFLYLVEAQEGVPVADRPAALTQTLAGVERDHPFQSLTFLMSDGLSLYAYRSHSAQGLEPGETADTRAAYFTLWTAQALGVHLVCSQPILPERFSWQPLKNQELAVLAGR